MIGVEFNHGLNRGNAVLWQRLSMRKGSTGRVKNRNEAAEHHTLAVYELHLLAHSFMRGSLFIFSFAQHAQTAQTYGASYSAVRVPSLSLAELCKSHGLKEIDFLKIDVEGGERDVLEGGDWQLFRPAIVMVEAISPLINAPAWEAWEPILLNQGYCFALFDTLNRFYVAEERPDLLSRLPCERAPWDAVRHMYEIGRAPENVSHPDHTLAMQLTRGFWATLPFLSDELLTSFLQRGAGGPEKPTVSPAVNSEAFRFSLGRIACGYDGGQLDNQ